VSVELSSWLTFAPATEAVFTTGAPVWAKFGRLIQEVARQAVTFPIRLSRLEVTVPFRVLPCSGVAGSLGYLLPVWSWRSLKHLAYPVFLPLPLLKEATP
jgi:hypothetical protein